MGDALHVHAIQSHVDQKPQFVPAPLEVIMNLHPLFVAQVARQGFQLKGDAIPGDEIRIQHMNDVAIPLDFMGWLAGVGNVIRDQPLMKRLMVNLFAPSQAHLVLDLEQTAPENL